MICGLQLPTITNHHIWHRAAAQRLPCLSDPSPKAMRRVGPTAKEEIPGGSSQGPVTPNGQKACEWPFKFYGPMFFVDVHFLNGNVLWWISHSSSIVPAATLNLGRVSWYIRWCSLFLPRYGSNWMAFYGQEALAKGGQRVMVQARALSFWSHLSTKFVLGRSPM